MNLRKPAIYVKKNLDLNLGRLKRALGTFLAWFGVSCDRLP